MGTTDGVEVMCGRQGRSRHAHWRGHTPGAGYCFPWSAPLFWWGLSRKDSAPFLVSPRPPPPTPAPVFCYVPASPCSCLDKYLQIMRLMHLDSWEGKTFPPVTLWLPNPLHYHTLNGAWGSSSGLSQENKILRVLFFPFLLKIVSLIASRLCL